MMINADIICILLLNLLSYFGGLFWFVISDHISLINKVLYKKVRIGFLEYVKQ